MLRSLHIPISRPRSLMFAVFTVVSFLLFFAPVHAADPQPTIRDSAYSAQYVSQSISDPITIEAGKTKTVTVKFRNVGTQTWNSLNEHPNGYRHVSAYAMEPRDRVSDFFGNGWISKTQTTSIDADTKPGETATLSLTLHAPQTPGSYIEEFYLAAENHSWIQGGYFFLKLNVVASSVDTQSSVDSQKVVEELPEADKDSGVLSSELLARVAGQSKTDVSVKGGEVVSLVLIYRNKGEQAWNGYTIEASAPTALDVSGTSLSFAHETWRSARAVYASDATVEPGGFFRQKFLFRAPAEEGGYTATFYVATNSETVAGSQAHVNVHVTERAPLGYKAPTFLSADTPIIPKEPRLKEEPRIRVGLETTGTAVQFVSFDDDYTLYDGDEEVIVLTRKKPGIFSYDDNDGTYRFHGAGLDITTTKAFRLVPKNNEHAVFTLKKGLKDRSVAWVGPSTFTRYRGAFEYRKGTIDNKLYVVNDLLLEDYVEGIAETGKGTHVEAVKANLVAARSYAFISKGKYPFFDVVGSTYDQLYLGDDVKDNLVDVGSAAKATRGQMVNYGGEIVTTPYFGNSYGKTRSWTSVWGGSHKPWLVPVVAKYDAGRRQFGHGVGMSQRDAALRAKNDGWTSEQLLTHYYTDTEIEVVYK
jgi:hypothetical protein